MTQSFKSRCRVVTKRAVVAIVLTLASNLRGALFEDSFETGTGAWLLSGNWGLTTSASYSPTRSMTDSPGAFYANLSETAVTLATPLDLSGVATPALRFYHRYAIEPSYDWASVQVSTNAGLSWDTLASYTGTRAAWTREQLDLAALAGAPDVRLRFTLTTDESVVMDGWYFDDVLIGEAPAAPLLTNVTAQGVSAVALAWAPSTTPTVIAYRVYRSQTAGCDWREAQLLGETDASTTTFSDRSAAPKARFYYRVLAVTDEALHAASNEATVVLPAGMDYPFLDTGEAGGTYWIADGGWSLSEERTAAGVYAWSDSPGSLYENGANASLRLAMPLDFSTALAPVLTFSQMHDILAGDAGVVEISLNNGTDWTVLKTYAGTTSTNFWTRERHSLAAYAGQASVLIRFRLTTSASGQADGWWLDDIAVAEAPGAVPTLLLDQVTSHTIRLSWPQNTNTVFARYAVHRVMGSAGVTHQSTCVAVIADQAQTTWTDAGLALDTDYAYRVYAVSPYGVYSEDGAESSTRTLNNPIPFADGFEYGDLNWNFRGAWGITSETNATGNACLTDSPLGFYAINQNSANNYALTAVDLTGATWPVLRFRDRHAFYDVAAGDRGILEVSSDGSNWTRVYGVSYRREDWAEQTIDLSRWRGQANLRIRFYIESNHVLAEDGWFIDDVVVEENLPQAAQALPFAERFEGGLTNWIAGGWVVSTNNPHQGLNCARDLPSRWSPASTESWLALNRELDLSGTVSPQITLWARGLRGSSDYGQLYVYLSKDNGLTWMNLSGVLNFDAQWTRFQYAIPANYRVPGVRLVIRSYTYRFELEKELYIDKLTVEEAPPAVTLTSLVPHLKSVDLAWSAYPDDGTFGRYEVYRRDAAGVAVTDTLVASLSDRETLTFTDTGLSIGKTYYYKVFTVNSNDTYTASNEAQATTVPLTLPFADNLDDASQWDTLGGWGVETNGAESFLSDSPGVQHANNLNNGNNYALTAVDLSSTTWPVLRFKDRYAFYAAAAGDRGVLEVSPNGVNWTRVYGVTAMLLAWDEQIIDLSRWRGQENVRIRFYIESNGSLVEDGWCIDDVTVEEHVPVPAQPLPFADRFEGGLTNWIAGGWVASTNMPYEGLRCARDLPSRWSPASTESWLALNRELDLSGTASPQITLWARGLRGYDNYGQLYVYLSKDGGLTWKDLSGVLNFDASWTRFQYAIPPDYRVPGVRLVIRSYTYRYELEKELYIDKLTVEETPPAVTLASPVPHLKSVELSWSVYPDDGTFQHYEIYRREAAGVTLADTLVASLSDRETLTFTDTGLSIGKTYYYKVFTVNSNDTYTTSNEAQATTVPLTLPFADNLDDASHWDTIGGWGVETNDVEVFLSDSPGVQYANSLNSGNNYALTAIDLSETTWPVLRFKDRYAFYAAAAGDRGVLEVSPNGVNWTRVYGVSGSREAWAEQAIDLSRWRGQANVRIRFYLESNGSLVEDGWFIDDVAIEEHVPVPAQPLPFTERFEGGLTNWIAGGWIASTNMPYEGLRCARDLPSRWSPASTESWLALNRELDLSGTASPQITLWARGLRGYDNYGQLYVYLSKDGGLTWRDLSGVLNFVATWTRFQYAIPADYRVPGVRLVIRSYTYRYELEKELYIDKLTVEEAPPAVTLETPSDVTVSALSLAWSPYAGDAFQYYKVYRHTAQNVNETHTLLATITDPATTNFVDSGLSARTRYFYNVYVYDESDTGTPSNEASAQTLGVPLGWMDSFDLGVDPAWSFSGTWGIQAGAGVDGSAALTDSPGDYANNSDTWAQTAIDLSAATWPVLVFKDRHALPPSGDNAYVEIGVADNANIASIAWTTVYSVRELRSAWREQQIDLSRWKGRHTVYIRFRLGANSSVVDDGWAIDDVALREHAPLPATAALHERFENGLGAWINGGWSASADTPYDGAVCAVDHTHQTVQADTDSWLVYGGELALTGALDPKVTLWARGRRGYNNSGRLYLRLSKDGGVTWLDLSNILSVVGPWSRFQFVVPMDYRTNGVRLAVQSYAYRYDLDSQFFIDAVGIGDEPPGAPAPLTPGEGATVTILRPTLTVANATDSQSDPLTYSFEVYTNAALTAGALVAQNPAIAAGTDTTAWQLDADLPDGAQLWWRCRATDSGDHPGPWSGTATFFVNLQNTPPEAPEIVGPYAAATLPDANGYFVWFASSDADAGDAVTGYQLQIAADASFTNILVSGAVAAQPVTLVVRMNTLPGYGTLALNARYHWRVRALDIWDEPSAWSTTSFIYGELQQQPPKPPEPVTITGLTVANGQVQLSWTESALPVRIEFTPSLTNPAWAPVAGASALGGTAHSFACPPGGQGFFQVVVEE